MKQQGLKDLKCKIADRKAVISVVGLGYVGLPLACAFAEKGFRVIGYDISLKKISEIQRPKAAFDLLMPETLRRLQKNKRLTVTADASFLAKADAVIICVPTPLNKFKEPDISFVMASVDAVRKNFKRGQLIILESTTYPGTTDELILPRLEAGKYKAGIDFALCFSPERINPGSKDYPVTKIPKVIGGITPLCRDLGAQLYASIIQQIIPVSSTRVAEFAKLLENTFRNVNIGLVNELAQVSEKMGVNIWEVIEAAKTKPFGFMPFYPGPGIGGHCIGIDALYLSWKVRQVGEETQLVDIASRINASMPQYVVKRAAQLLNKRNKSINRARILVLGVSYKPEVADIRESPALEIIDDLRKLGAQTDYYDPWVKKLELGRAKLTSKLLSEAWLKKIDLAILVTNHQGVDYAKIIKNVPQILDTRNGLKNLKTSRQKIVLL